MEYAQVTERLYIGSRPETIADIEILEKILAITAVLNLQTDEDMAAVNLNWPPLESHYRACSVRLCRMPMQEEQAVIREKVCACVEALDGLIAAGNTVYLHCTAGIGRAPTLAIGYLYRCLGWQMDAAVRYVKQVRQCSPHVEALRRAIADQEQRESADIWTLM